MIGTFTGAVTSGSYESRRTRSPGQGHSGATSSFRKRRRKKGLRELRVGLLCKKAEFVTNAPSLDPPELE